MEIKITTKENLESFKKVLYKRNTKATFTINNISILKNQNQMNQENELVIDLSLENQELYAGCQIEEVGGRKNLTTPTQEMGTIIVKNLRPTIEKAVTEGTKKVVLTGAMSIESYLFVFHEVLHRFTSVEVLNGRGQRTLIAAHG